MPRPRTFGSQQYRSLVLTIARFHVDGLSSAHVYLRPQAGWTLDTIPQDVLTDCAQLVKANSIEGNKKNDVKVVYTPASNLCKEASFDVGQVAFFNNKLVRQPKGLRSPL